MDKPLTQNILSGRDYTTFQEYTETGGYQGLRAVINGYTPEQVQQQIKESGLRGRGGAGFPTGMKWSFVPMGEQSPKQKYFVANADEMEPGSFKDRLLMEKDPHQLIEGIIISAYAIEASIAYIFLRGEYVEATKRLQVALAESYKNNLLGQNILDSKYNLEIYLHTSAGRYICGEETALLNSLEGKRATPRSKPPFPQISGLWGLPTIVNNVETVCNVPHILRNGVDWYKSLGLGENDGTKIYGVSGRVKNPGAWELPLGTSAREIIENKAGGMLDDYQLKGFLPGGASTDFLLPEHLDIAMDYETVAQAGSRLGTGTIIILDNKTDVVAMVLNLERFFAQESCGWCTPCRDGLPWTVKLLEDLLAGNGKPEDLGRLSKLTRLLGPGNTFCALAPGAMEPLQSALKYFRADFEHYLDNEQIVELS